MESQGLALHKSYPHASTLLADYFRSAASVLDHCGDADQAAWFLLVQRFLQEGPGPGEGPQAGRDELQELIRLTPECRHWQTPLRLAAAGTANCLAYLRQSASLEQTFAGRLDAVEPVIAACAADDLDTLLALLPTLAEFPASGQDLLLSLAMQLPDGASVIALLEGAEQLPLDRPRILSDWLHHGLDEAAGNSASLVAWLRLESLSSRQSLMRLRGEVCLADHHRTFDLLVEALSARELMIDAMPGGSSGESSGGAPEFRREAPVTPDADARSICLPESVRLFDNSKDNFAFYKVAIFHQVGFVEFGCLARIDHLRLRLNAHRDQRLAWKLFRLVEDARIDWQLEHRYPGLAPQLQGLKSLALANRKTPVTRRARLLEILVRTGLDGEAATDPQWQGLADRLRLLLRGLSVPDASLDDALAVVSACYDLIAGQASSLLAGPEEEAPVTPDTTPDANPDASPEELPEPVSFRGEINLAGLADRLKIESLALQEEAELLPDDPGLPGAPDEPVEVGDLQPGEVSEGVSMLIPDLQRQPDTSAPDAENGGDGLPFPGSISARSRETSRYRYDEWDYAIADYRAHWCTLYEHRDLEEDHACFRNSLADNRDLARRVRQQLNRVRPEMLRKVKGVSEGEEPDLERAVSYLVDRRAGLTPDETIYVQRQRRERDVSTLFLLDMSASTDDLIPDPDAMPPPLPDPDASDDYLMQYFEHRQVFEADARRIIDLEKESVILMADALESLGDAWSVCGFSGYGKDQVDYYICKDFDEPFDARAQGRIGGIRPCRSTRMGAPVRHATRRLMATGSRIKALIIISDGYPQDHDYGADRNSREYGLNDTMKALSEAKQQGLLSYCLTVDPSGHDYLRAMCPDSQYMVIQDLGQLPEELARVYRSLTG